MLLNLFAFPKTVVSHSDQPRKPGATPQVELKVCYRRQEQSGSHFAAAQSCPEGTGTCPGSSNAGSFTVLKYQQLTCPSSNKSTFWDSSSSMPYKRVLPFNSFLQAKKPLHNPWEITTLQHGKLTLVKRLWLLEETAYRQWNQPQLFVKKIYSEMSFSTDCISPATASCKGMDMLG